MKLICRQAALSLITIVLTGCCLLVLLCVLLIYSDQFRIWGIKRLVENDKLSLAISQTELSHLGWEPRFILYDVSVDNKKWPQPKQVVKLNRLSIQISLSELVRRRQIRIENLIINTPTITLMKNKAGEANWSLSKSNTTNETRSDYRGFPLIIEKILLENANGNYVDAVSEIKLEGSIHQLKGSGGWQMPLSFTADGIYQNKKFTLTAKSGAYSQLQSFDKPYPVSLDMTYGKTEIGIHGTLMNPLDKLFPHLDLALKGQNISELIPIILVPLPPSSPYTLSGLVTRSGQIWRFNKIRGEIGNSDIEGTISIHTETKPLSFDMDLFSDALDLADLSGFIGGEPAEVSTKQDGLIPDRTLNLDILRLANGKGRLRAKNIIRKELPISEFDGRVSLENGVLRFEPVKFVIADGTVNLWVSAYGKNKPPQVDVEIHVLNLALSKFFKTIEKVKKTGGLINGKLKLEGKGNTVKTILSSATGQAYLMLVNGKISAFIVEVLGLDIVEALGFYLLGDKQIPILCAVLDADIRNGVAVTKSMILNTQDTVVYGKGKLSFKSEDIQLSLTPFPRDFSPLTLRSTLNVTGTLLKPKVSIDPLSTLMLLPPIDIGDAQTVDCHKLIKNIKN